MPPSSDNTAPSNSESNHAAPGGYHGGYRRIDVTTGQSDWVPLEASVLRRFLGGSGLGTYLLLRENAATVDPLAPEAPLAFVFSPLVGSPLTTSAKFAVVCKSPLTQRINDSLASSHFAIAGKKTGADALLLTGRAAEPSILVIDGEQTRLEPAGELWGLPIPETERKLRERYDKDYHFAVIGPAGERQIRYATVSHDGRHAGRGGSGAVLGAKNIKAIAVRGSQKCAWAQPKQLIATAKDLSARSFGPATEKYRELGTAANLLVFNRLHALPTKNFQQGSFENAAELSPEQLATSREKTKTSCAACTIGCEHLYGLKRDGDASGETTSVRVEYENLFALGPLCGISDSNAVLSASQKCDALGLDTISTGGTIAFAMECVERGILDAPWLTFGSGEALLRAIDEIVQQTELGKLLATGSRQLAHTLGHDSIDFAPQVKGLEIPGYEPRALQTMALGFAVGTRGADHNRSGAYEVDFSDGVDRRNVGVSAVAGAIETENKAALMDSLILCKFLRGVFDDFAAEAAVMLNQVTGWDTTAEELMATAERIVAARKLFNMRAGWTAEEDTLPARFLEQPLPDDSKAVLSRTRLETLVTAYNQDRYGNSLGEPTVAHLEQLGLGGL